MARDRPGRLVRRWRVIAVASLILWGLLSWVHCPLAVFPGVITLAGFARKFYWTGYADGREEARD